MSESKPNVLGLFENPTHLIMRDGDDIRGVILRDELKMQIDLLCANVKNQVVLISFFSMDGKEKMEFIDSTISARFFHYCCGAVRACAGEAYCKESDRDHARLFLGIDGAPMRLEDMDTQVTANIKHYMEKMFPNAIYKNDLAPWPEYVPWRFVKGGYIKYYCPMLGFHEMVFPVVVQGLVLGVIVRGQIQNDDEIGKKIRVSFADRDEVFEDFFSKHQYDKNGHLYTREGLKEALKKGKNLYAPESIVRYPWGEDWISLESHAINEAFVENIRQALATLTENLESSMRKFKTDYVSHIIKKASLSFYDDVINSIISQSESSGRLSPENKNALSDEHGICPYWGVVEKSLKFLVESLDLRDIQVYGSVQPHSEVETIEQLELVAFFSRDVHEEQDINELKEVFRFCILPRDKKNPRMLFSSRRIMGNATIKVERKLYKRIVHTLDGKQTHPEDNKLMTLLYYPVPDNWFQSSALVINREHWSDDACDYIVDTIMSEMPLFTSQIFHVSSYLLDNLLQADTTRILHFFNHELSHLLLGYNFLNETYVKNFEYYASLSPKERLDVERDFTGTEEMMKSISNNIQMLTKPKSEIKLKEEKFKVFKEVLWKWRDLFRNQANDKNLRFVIPPTSSDDAKRPLVNTDKRLFEQIIYNLVHNAIKYSHWGTKIEIDCRVVYENKPHSQVLSVADYGMFIESSRRPYLLYYRNRDTKQYVEGSGIGLFVAKRIVDILGMTVKHTCKEVSKYNVGLIETYLGMPDKDIELAAKLQAEKRKLGDKLWDMVNMHFPESDDDAPPPELPDNEDIRAMICRPTYKVVFEVEI